MKWNSRPLTLAALGTLLTVMNAVAQNNPVATDRTPIASEDTVTTIFQLATDREGDPLTYTVAAGPVHGFLSGTPQGLIYPPAEDFSGPASLTFRASDGSVDSNMAVMNPPAVRVDDAPTGTVKINIGKASATRSTLVQLTLTAADAGGGALQMCISNTATCRTWSKFAPTRSWKLAAGSGWKTVNVWFRDQWGKKSAAPVSDKILLDTTAPSNATVTAVQSATRLTLHWKGSTDGAGSGIARYRAVFKEGSSAPSSCATGTLVPGYAGTATTLVHTGLVTGMTYGYRICSIDVAGNVSTGATVIGRLVPPDTTPPSGTVTINGGAMATRSTVVRLRLMAADDGGGAIEMCISNTATCSSWTPFEATKNWTLAAGSGWKTVNVWFRVPWGKTTATPSSDTILLDMTAPSDGTVAAVQGDKQLTLNWSGFTDTNGSGITGYRAVFQEGSAPSSCSMGTLVTGYAGTATTLVQTGLVNGTTYGYRICAIDAVGNISSGAMVTGQPVPSDTTPPSGTVTIDGGAVATRSTMATLSLTAADDGGGAILMCISNTATCSNWAPFEATKNWVLAVGNGTTTVNVWYRDQWGNMSATPNSDTIFRDTTAPTDGTVTATPGDTQLTLNWSGFADTAGSGITGYQAFFQEGSVPSSCSGTTVPGYAGTATTLVHTGLTNGTIYGYRVCAIDAADNISSGATASGHPVSSGCEICHGQGGSVHPGIDGIPGTADDAPNVMTYWDGSWWDSNKGGSNSKQQGGHGDPDHFAARQCPDCHDIALPDPSTHLDGIYNSIWGNSSGSRNQNTAHLKASFIGGTTPAWSVQLTLDTACWGCHNTIGGIQDMRHERDGVPAAGVLLFGTHLSRGDGDTLPLPIPNIFIWPGPYPTDQDISTNATGSAYYAPCVSCHDPHGTGASAKSGESGISNFMLRDGWSAPSTLCKVCHP